MASDDGVSREVLALATMIEKLRELARLVPALDPELARGFGHLTADVEYRSYAAELKEAGEYLERALRRARVMTMKHGARLGSSEDPKKGGG